MPALKESHRQALLDELSGLRRFCLSLTASAADADDLLQATVERLLAKGMPDDANPVKWSYRVCRNLWIDELRSREVRSRSMHKVAEPEDGVPSAETTAIEQRQLERVTTALAGLPDEQRLALTLVAVEGKSYAEAADILEVPVGTIMSRISRARKQLVDRLQLNNEELR